mmetsp:Transcript_8071/g.15075  ORF Transcript_8071/g.15075 Transcript_8071/m.15075 type:complete len:206 (+) Transcript_8071:89-706(+)
MARLSASLALLAAAFALTAVAEESSGEIRSALSFDDACGSAGPEGCSLEMRQLRVAQSSVSSEKQALEQMQNDADEEAQEDAAHEDQRVATDPVVAAAVGKCLNAQDILIWNGRGKQAFDHDLAYCGRKCAAGVPCTKDCMHGEIRRYSLPCAGCMANLVQCSASPKCINQCITGQSPACNKCVKAKCRPAFVACSGLDAGGHDH